LLPKTADLRYCLIGRLASDVIGFHSAHYPRVYSLWQYSHSIQAKRAKLALDVNMIAFRRAIENTGLCVRYFDSSWITPFYLYGACMGWGWYAVRIFYVPIVCSSCGSNSQDPTNAVCGTGLGNHIQALLFSLAHSATQASAVFGSAQLYWLCQRL